MFSRIRSWERVLGPILSASVRSLLQQYPSWAVKCAAHLVFLAVAAAFTYLFWQHEKSISFVRYLGAAVTLWASFHGAYHFTQDETEESKTWFRGLSVVFLGIYVLACLGLMASHSSVLAHSLVIHSVLGLYIAWDLLALHHYRTISGWWHQRYKSLLGHDVWFFFLYLATAYLPFIPRLPQLLGFSSDKIDTIADFTTLFVLIAEGFEFVRISFRGNPSRMTADAVLDVQRGYTKWAPVYNKGNGVIAVEREHTRRRINELSIANKAIVDFGCGTGSYLPLLQQAGAASVLGIDGSGRMLAQFAHETTGCISVREGGVGALAMLPEHSADGVFCTLVVDHLPLHDYRDFLLAAARVLKPRGWLYITDANPYFEIREHHHARFWDERGVESRVQIYPHTVGEVFAALQSAGFQDVQVREGMVSAVAASQREELRDMVGFPLILEYFCIRS